ncbi:MAG: class I cytochrome c [Burkholderiaceae bacterium]|jgi:cytochrome c|nr:class I cytochrome c [Burkholderiaceae bacterium]
MKTTSPLPIAMACLAAGVLLAPGSALAADEEAAVKTLRQNSCFRCHAVNRGKSGPAWQKISQKYHSRPGAEERLTHYLTSEGQVALFPDGHEEPHKTLQGSARDDPETMKNLVQWILSR